MEYSDLTGFAALLGESLSAKVGLLERLLRGGHYPSLGRYKEKLLADTIKSYVPTSVEIGNGFVLFPHKHSSPAVPDDMYDPLNQSAYSISRQCDVIVYDVANYPPIFRDGDFVVVRPEAVRAVIEVKGALSHSALYEALDSFDDFSAKWVRTRQFYKEHNQGELSDPGMYLMAWDVQRDKSGRPRISPTAVREKMAKYYADRVKREQLKEVLLPGKLLIYNECVIEKMYFSRTEDGEHVLDYGWMTVDGRFIRVGADGAYFRDKDRTVASLLAAIHWDVSRKNFNRFLSYTDEVRQGHSALPYGHGGASWVWTFVGDGEDA